MQAGLIALGGGALAAAPEVPLPDLGNLTATAILGWFAWHTAAKKIPGLVAEFRAELAATRAEYREDREVFRKEIAEERLQRHADHLAIVQAVQELSTTLRPPPLARRSPDRIRLTPTE